MPFYVWVIIVFVIIIGSFMFFIRTPKGKGFWGEFQIKIKLGKSRKNKKYVFNNYKFEVDGKTSQIDHIVVNKNGVFVIETKNYAGRIYGNENQYEWTQVLAGGKVKNKFYNPIKQNKSHIYCLEKILPKNTKFVSIIVFVNNNIRFIQSDNVCATNKLKKLLKQKREKTFSQSQILEIVEILEKNKNEKISNKKHIKNIKRIRKNIENNLCPRCSSQLVLRDGKYGQFYGCSNYPKCKFKKNL